ncbi:MAG: hypothetical protein HY958_12870 [Bacteroidia bacterium]|nr:hypothetical protein [Bacteroidia bacterium]
MKKLLFFIYIAMGFGSYLMAQTTGADTTVKKNPAESRVKYVSGRPGDQLIKASNHFYLGVGLMLGGTVASVIGAGVVQNNPKDGVGSSLIVCGAFAAIAGMVYSVEWVRYIKKAGILMNLQDVKKTTTLYITPVPGGISLVYKF